MSFPAQWAGTCPACGTWYPADSDIGYVTGYDKPVCADCLTSTRKPPREAPLCPDCWTRHAGECL